MQALLDLLSLRAMLISDHGYLSGCCGSLKCNLNIDGKKENPKHFISGTGISYYVLPVAGKSEFPYDYQKCILTLILAITGIGYIRKQVNISYQIFTTFFIIS